MKRSWARDVIAPGSRSGIQMPEVKNRLFNGVLVVAIIVATLCWVYALGWVAFKLFEFI